MDKHTFFFTPLCPQCPPFMEELKRLNIEVNMIDITESIVNLKQFIKLRDKHEAFNTIKENGFVGIPLLITTKNQFIFSIEELKLMAESDI